MSSRLVAAAREVVEVGNDVLNGEKDASHLDDPLAALYRAVEGQSDEDDVLECTIAWNVETGEIHATGSTSALIKWEEECRKVSEHWERFQDEES